MKHKIIVSPLDGDHVDGSVQITATCGHRAWIAPTGLQAVLDPGMPTETICLRCLTPGMLKELARDGGLRALPGAKVELEGAIGKVATEELYRRFHIREGL